jgi:hypothetical protein
MYTSKVDWAPPIAECSQADLAGCAGIADCNVAGFADQYGANTDYEDSWVNCRASCSPSAWEAYCIGMQCQGSLHKEQCSNVTNAVKPSYQVAYRSSAEPAWVAGDRCRSVGDMCDNDATLGKAGFFGWMGFAFLTLAQILLLAYRSMDRKDTKFKVLLGSLANFTLGWMWLLISWAIFASAVGSEATCVVMDASATGAVVATGNFGDIINASGSYSYAFVIASWIITSFVIVLMAQHVYTEAAKRRQPDQKVAESEKAKESSSKDADVAVTPAAVVPQEEQTEVEATI